VLPVCVMCFPNEEQTGAKGLIKETC